MKVLVFWTLSIRFELGLCPVKQNNATSILEVPFQDMFEKHVEKWQQNGNKNRKWNIKNDFFKQCFDPGTIKIESGMSNNPRIQIVSSFGAKSVELWRFYIKKHDLQIQAESSGCHKSFNRSWFWKLIKRFQGSGVSQKDPAWLALSFAFVRS